MTADSDLGKICLSCGLCCNGTLHTQVGITLKEREAAIKNGLRVIRGKPFFKQPCSKVVDNACTIYDDRPTRCRQFVCNILATHEQEGLPLEESLEKVRRFKELAAELKERGLDPKPGGAVSVEGPDGFEVVALLQEYAERYERDLGRASPMFTDEVPIEAYTVPEGELPDEDQQAV